MADADRDAAPDIPEPTMDAGSATDPDGHARSSHPARGPLHEADGTLLGIVSGSRDATDPTGAQEALRESEERYRSLVDEIDAVISVHDVRAGKWFMSPQTEAMFGFPPEQMAEPGFWRSRVVEEDRERVDAVWDDDQDLDAYQLEYRMRRADGSIVWVEERQHSVKGPDGRAVRWHGLALDITERRRLAAVERERATLGARLGYIVRLARDIVLLLDESGRIVDANDAATEAYGYTHDELRRLTIADIRAPESVPSMEAQLAAAARPEGALFETVHRRRDGTTFPVEVSSHVVDIDGEPYRQSIVRDITERRRADEALRASEARYASLVAELPVGVYVARTRPDGATRLEFLSAQARRLLGVESDTLPDEPDAALSGIHPDDVGALAALLAGLYADPQPVHWEGRAAVRGEWRTLRFVSEPHGFEGGELVTQGFIEDITEQRRAEDALAAREAELREAQRIAHVGSWSWVRASDQATWSDEQFSIFGRDPADGAPSFAAQLALYAAESATRLAADVGRALETGEPYETPIEILRPDGSSRYAIARGEVVRDAAGGVAGLRGTVTDLTEAHAAEEALRASEALAMAVIQGTADAIYVKDPDGKMLLVNEVTARALGRTAESMLGLDERSWFPPDQADAIMSADRSVLERGTPLTVEEAITDGEGRIRWYLNTKSPLFAADGSVIGLLAVAREISGLKQTEEALRASATLQQSVFETLTDGVVVYDAHGRIVAANPRAEEIFGMGADRVVGGGASNPAWTVFDEDGEPIDPDHLPANVTVRTGAPARDVILELVRPDGRHLWLRLNTRALHDADGAITGVVASMSDITGQRALEARLRRSQRLEAIGQLAGGIAHDFNNLLAAITGYAEFARESLPEESPTREDIDEILRAADRASGLTRQLLAFSRRLTLRPEVVDPAAVVDQLVPMLRRLLGEHIELATDWAPDLGHVLVDPGQLEQVVVNLAVNARDAMPDGGRLSITLESAEGAHPHGDAAALAGRCVRMTVRDTGVGMDAETAAKAFEPFFTTKDVGKGSGMGLATVYGIVEQSGGHISVASEPGAGATFTIDFPLVDAPVSAPAAPAVAELPAAGGETILLVEDEGAVLRAASRILRELGYGVVEAASPEAALSLSDDTIAAVDLLVTDVVMPGMSGVRLAEVLEDRRPGLRTVLVSGFAPEDALAGRLDRPGTSFIGKPYAREDLARAVRAALDAE